MITVEHLGRQTTIRSGIHNITITPAVSEPGIVIHATGTDDMIVVPADMFLALIDAALRAGGHHVGHI